MIAEFYGHNETEHDCIDLHRLKQVNVNVSLFHDIVFHYIIELFSLVYLHQM